MNKCVLLSIRPQYCELIASGKKTIEVRKSRPKLDTPFKCYIYCTKDGYTSMFSGKKFLEHNGYPCHGKVIGEFVCDTLHAIPFLDDKTICAKSCLTPKEIVAYGGNKPLYGWHISALQIYDKPKELSEFYTYDPTYNNSFGWCFTEEERRKYFTRPPQSWCYVEELV